MDAHPHLDKRRLIQDALGRDLDVPAHPVRVVSLAATLTELVFDLHATHKLACPAPPALVPRNPLGRRLRGAPGRLACATILALQPDLALALGGANRERDITALTTAGLPVYVTEIENVEDAVAAIGEIADLLDVAGPHSEALRAAVSTGVAAARALAHTHRPVSVFCPVRRDPWVAVGRWSYTCDLLEHAGASLLVLGSGRATYDRRYEWVDFDEIVAKEPELVLLPMNPCPFGSSDATELQARLPRSRIQLCDSRLLFGFGRATGEVGTLAGWVAETAAVPPRHGRPY